MYTHLGKMQFEEVDECWRARITSKSKEEKETVEIFSKTNRCAEAWDRLLRSKQLSSSAEREIQTERQRNIKFQKRYYQVCSSLKMANFFL